MGLFSGIIIETSWWGYYWDHTDNSCCSLCCMTFGVCTDLCLFPFMLRYYLFIVSLFSLHADSCIWLYLNDMFYTRFPSQDSGLFGPNPWEILAPPSKYISNKVSGQPNPWRKSCEGKSCDGNWELVVFGLISIIRTTIIRITFINNNNNSKETTTTNDNNSIHTN